jgi:Ca-activated chloride channel family protein
MRARTAIKMAICLITGLVASTTGCSKKSEDARRAPMALKHEPRRHEVVQEQGSPATEAYERIVESPFVLAAATPLSTFSIDVDTASYSNVRRILLENRQLPPKDAVRIEEFINYFKYDYPPPQDGVPVSVSAEVAACPWNEGHRLVRIGLQGKTIPAEDMPPRNLVFLVDTSGSMNAPNRLPLLTEALVLLTRQLTVKDRVAIVAYAGSAGLVLPATPGDQHARILAAIDSLLHAGGSTNGAGGIVLAYRVAQENFMAGGANRVILGTDGDFNVGVTSQAELIRLIEEKRQTGVYLSVLGFGMGNLKNTTMESLAQHGNGQYAYIDTQAEARKVFVEDVANLVPIARDVKIQVEFNPTHVQAYRLVGYENRLLKDQDFNDDRKDAGDMGAGHAVTALYEVVPPGVNIAIPGIDPLKYQKRPEPAPAADSPELLTVKVRYIPPTETRSRLLSVALRNNSRAFSDASPDFRFAAAVAAFGMLLRDSQYKGQATYTDILRLARDARGQDLNGQREQFLRLVHDAQQLARQGRAERD